MDDFEKRWDKFNEQGFSDGTKTFVRVWYEQGSNVVAQIKAEWLRGLLRDFMYSSGTEELEPYLLRMADELENKHG